MKRPVVALSLLAPLRRWIPDFLVGLVVFVLLSWLAGPLTAVVVVVVAATISTGIEWLVRRA